MDMPARGAGRLRGAALPSTLAGARLSLTRIPMLNPPWRKVARPLGGRASGWLPRKGVAATGPARTRTRRYVEEPATAQWRVQHELLSAKLPGA